MTIPERLEQVRQRMKEEGLDAYYIPTNDFHGSEYVGDYFKTREYISGFTGSAGTVIITAQEAGLWTDGRYFLQAADQLQGTGITLYRSGEEGVPTEKQYLEQLAAQKTNPHDFVLGCDGRLVTKAWMQMMAGQFTVRPDLDLVGDIWRDRPARSAEPIWILDEAYAGCTREEKLAKLWKWMEQYHLDQYVLTGLENIAWMFNIRGNDIACTPVALAYAVFTQGGAVLFTDGCADDRVRQVLQQAGVEIQPYEEIENYLQAITPGRVVAWDMNRINAHLTEQVSKEVRIRPVLDPIDFWKSVKNEVEMDNERMAHQKDAIAIVKMLYWIKTQVGKLPMSELSVAAKLEELRQLDPDYLGPSFTTIAGYAEHGAIVHYSATSETDKALAPDSFLLMDMGAHYYQGTTDITRTIFLGEEASEEEKKYYTAVLRGNLNLGAAKFRNGSSGVTLDILARQPLWEMGCDFNHGTGHGVGYLLNVHEGPNAIRYRIINRQGANVSLQPGMLTSNEPGIYLEGKFGIRLENLILCVEDEKNSFGQFLRFDTLTLVPFDRKAIDPSAMTDREIKLLNDYHKRVYETIAPFLTEQEGAWLEQECAPLGK